MRPPELRGIPRGSRSGRGGSLGPFGLWALVLLVALVGASPAAAQLRGLEVTSVSFEGNETFPDDSLARAIATRETECRSTFLTPLCWLGGFLNRSLLRERDLPRDRARLVVWYRRRGFRDVLVDSANVTRTPTTAQVSFRITEGRPVVTDSIAFAGVDGIEGPAGQGLLDGLPIRPGDRLSTITLDATRDTITRRLADRGFAYAEVLRNAFRPADDPYRAIVTFDIVPGSATTYGDISVAGTQDLSVATVLKTAQLTTGDTYRISEIEEARSRLYGLEIVRNASVSPDTLTFDQDPEVDIAIALQEGEPYRVRAGTGWSTSECLNLEARWTARNFLGGGRVLQVRARVGNLLAPNFRDVLCPQSGQGAFGRITGLAAVDFVQPWIFSTRNSLSASIFAERQSLPDIFIRRAVGAQVGLSRTLSPQTVVAGYYRPELSRLDADDVLFCTGFLVCSPDDVSRLEGGNWLSPVGLTLTRDRSDDLLNPRRGYRFVFDVEHAAAWTGSDFRYDRVVGEWSRYMPVDRSVVAARIRGGWVGPGAFGGAGGVDVVHPQKRFYTGGANSVRGFAQSRLGPRVLFAGPELLLSSGSTGGQCDTASLEALTCVPADSATFQPQPTGGTRLLEGNLEVRFPVASLFEGVVFTDVGQAWGVDQEVSLASLELTPGFGVRIPSPVGPIRIDLAYRFRGAQELPVVTESIRPYDAARDPESARLSVDNTEIDWVSTGDLVFLPNPFLFGENDRGFQLHISIGQAF